MNFDYIALNSKGKEISGTIDSESASKVELKLKEQGLYPIKITEVSKKIESKKSKKSPVKTSIKKTISSKVLMLFSRQLATLVDAGLPLIKSLEVLSKQEKNNTMKYTIEKLSESVSRGSTFSESLGQHPKLFDKLFINMVKSGELGGIMELVLTRIAEYKEKSQKLKNKITAAMVYPIVVIVLSVAILSFLLAVIVPKFEDIFATMLSDGSSLPSITLFVIAISNFIKTKWYILIILVLLIYIGFKFFKKTNYGNKFIDDLILKLPVFGDIQLKSSISKFSRTLGTLVSSGVPILQALNITKETTNNTIISKSIENIHNSVREGELMVNSMESSNLFPPMVVSMVDVGEETGKLPEMLLKVADVYDDEVDTSVDAMTSIIEPIMIIILALIVGTIVIALFLPMVTLISKANAAN